MDELKDKIISSVTFINGVLTITTNDGFEVTANGGNIDTTYMQVLDNNGNLVVHETQSF